MRAPSSGHFGLVHFQYLSDQAVHDLDGPLELAFMGTGSAGSVLGFEEFRL